MEIAKIVSFKRYMDAANPTSGLPWSVSTRGSASGSSGKGLSKGLKGRKCLERWRAQEERWGEAGGSDLRGWRHGLEGRRALFTLYL